MAVRKLFINNNGLDAYVEQVMINTKDNEEQRFADSIACKQYIQDQFKLSVKLPKIKSISLLEDGAMRVRTRDLFITTTDTGRLRKFFVGSWEVTASPDGRYCFKSNNKEELGFRSSIWGNNTVHPHISGRDGHGCLGNAATPLQLYLKTGSVKAMVLFILGYLESVNIEDSAGRWLGAVKEVMLDKDGTPMHEPDGNYLFVSENEFTRNGVPTIGGSARNLIDKKNMEYVTSEFRNCYVCGTSKNRDRVHSISTPNGTTAVCDDCKDRFKTCDICGELVKQSDTINGVCLCDKCKRAFFLICKMCNKPVIPADVNKDNIKDYIKLSLTDKETRKNSLVYCKTVDAYEATGLCDSCKSLVETNDIAKKSIPTFARATVTKSYAELPQKIGLGKYRIKCSCCGEYHYIENNVYQLRYDKYYCANCYSMSDNTRGSRTTAMIMDITKELIERNYIRITARPDGNRYKFTRLPFTSTFGSIYNRGSIKDIEKFQHIVNNEIEIPFNSTVNITNTEDDKDKCSICGKDLEGSKWLDKSGNPICAECSETVYGKCNMCGEMRPLKMFGNNLRGFEQYPSVCAKCVGIIAPNYTVVEDMSGVVNATNENEVGEVNEDDLPF